MINDPDRPLEAAGRPVSADERDPSSGSRSTRLSALRSPCAKGGEVRHGPGRALPARGFWSPQPTGRTRARRSQTAARTSYLTGFDGSGVFSYLASDTGAQHSRKDARHGQEDRTCKCDSITARRISRRARRYRPVEGRATSDRPVDSCS
jgi:hypothetical protein